MKNTEKLDSGENSPCTHSTSTCLSANMPSISTLYNHIGVISEILECCLISLLTDDFEPTYYPIVLACHRSLVLLLSRWWTASFIIGIHMIFVAPLTSDLCITRLKDELCSSLLQANLFSSWLILYRKFRHINRRSSFWSIWFIILFWWNTH
jgi:hypothetical protein